MNKKLTKDRPFSYSEKIHHCSNLIRGYNHTNVVVLHGIGYLNGHHRAVFSTTVERSHKLNIDSKTPEKCSS